MTDFLIDFYTCLLFFYYLLLFIYQVHTCRHTRARTCKYIYIFLFIQKQVVPFLTQAFGPIVSAIFNALAASSSAVNDEDTRLERQTLQRSYFSFIAALVGSGLMEVLASQDPSTLEQVLHSLIQGAVDYPDPIVIPFPFFHQSFSFFGLVQ